MVSPLRPNRPCARSEAAASAAPTMLKTGSQRVLRTTPAGSSFCGDGIAEILERAEPESGKGGKGGTNNRDQVLS